MEQIELYAIFRGQVQGVGFRWTVVDCATHFHLTGTTKNLPDGTVEVCAQGPKPSLDAFLVTLEQEPGFARIESVTSTYRQPNCEYHTFKIVY